MTARKKPLSSVRWDAQLRRWFWHCNRCHPKYGTGSTTTWRAAMDLLWAHLRRGEHNPFPFTVPTQSPAQTVGGCAACRLSGVCGCVINPYAPRIWSSVGAP